MTDSKKVIDKATFQNDFVALLSKCQHFDKMPLKARTDMLKFHAAVDDAVDSIYAWIERNTRWNEMDMLTLYAVKADDTSALAIARLLCLDESNSFHGKNFRGMVYNAVRRMNNINIDERFANTAPFLKRHKIEKGGWVENWSKFILAAHSERMDINFMFLFN
ncbi:MAG: hypothetical protein RIS64_3680 [Bacteroidota bacterium]|jgi:hypothetical protein